MKRLLTVLAVSLGVTFVASLLITNTAKTLTPENIEKAVRDPESIKILIPTIPLNRQILPTTSLIEYQIANFKNNAESQNIYANKV